MDRIHQQAIVASRQEQLLREAREHRLAARTGKPSARLLKRVRIALNLRPQPAW